MAEEGIGGEGRYAFVFPVCDSDALCALPCGFIENPGDAQTAIDRSSIDLVLSDQAYRMVDGAVKPLGGRYLHSITTLGLATRFKPDSDGLFRLGFKNTYVFKLRERIQGISD